jgi:hypothetical protein
LCVTLVIYQEAINCVRADIKTTARYNVGSESKYEDLNVMACLLISLRNRTCYVKPRVVDVYTKETQLQCSRSYTATRTMNGVIMLELLSLYCVVSSK